MKKIAILILPFVLLACSTEAVKEKKAIKKTQVSKNTLDQEHKIVDQKKLDNGISISWFKEGSGEQIKTGDLVMIDYKVKLKDGSVVDGNHLIKKPSFPFLVGFNMQTKGWDIAIQELKVGDFAEIIIPSPLARGEKGIEGLIPPNADNILIIRVLSKRSPDRVVEGTKVWILEENKKNKTKFAENNSILFHAIASSPSKPMYVNTFRSNQPFSFKTGDYGLVPGLRKALINAKKSDRLYILVPSKEAYGADGYLDLVKPNEDVFYNILVMDVVKN